MANIAIGQPVKDFVTLTTGHQRIQLSQLGNHRVLLFFYPKNGTPACIIENQDFAANHPHFLRYNTLVFGVSRDDLASQEAFKKSLSIPFELIADPQGHLCEYFDVLHANERDGKDFLSLRRSTFLIDEQGRLMQAWRNVQVKNHVHQLLSYIQQADAKPQ